MGENDIADTIDTIFFYILLGVDLFGILYLLYAFTTIIG